MKKVLLTATVQSHIAQFHKPLINLLKEKGYEVHVAARNNLSEKNGLQLNEPDKVFNLPFDRSPLSMNNIIAYRDLKKLLLENKYDVVHCNTPMGGIVTRLAVNKYRKIGTKVFYTAHGFHFYEGSPKKNWLLYYPIEKYFARFTDKLITITNEDFKLAKNRFKTDVVHIHGVGVNSQKYYPVNEENKLKIKEKFGYKDSDYIILCTGELNKNKNQITLINSMVELKKAIPNIKLLLAGDGPLRLELTKAAERLNVSENVDFLGYRTDLENFVNIADIILSASIREGLPLNIMEGMLCNKVIIVSNNRGHSELIKHNFNGLIVSKNAPECFTEQIMQLKNDTHMQSELSYNAYNSIQKYLDKNVTKELNDIYQLG